MKHKKSRFPLAGFVFLFVVCILVHTVLGDEIKMGTASGTVSINRLSCEDIHPFLFCLLYLEGTTDDMHAVVVRGGGCMD